jgi:hypothetical protein
LRTLASGPHAATPSSRSVMTGLLVMIGKEKDDVAADGEKEKESSI